ncbi:hypothetical protein GLAREA_01289 [Glarea lozoyensis ATCC 20868]|uniref:Uncharacterized protein n=1 Tax=Glarea lozoyensis (strain ATCC 20868 / MF5171) TaxID=1116229 RepID=S3CFU6_GLAL2|nr:uncharacterized protein GLAREA_01289 [Glarea lozoyensis ATCC 20868]EPE25377.1 hypothetical protein GLAREA_01289 [Glarea lozoyensis ATCC 20868]
MLLQLLPRVLATAAILTTSVRASPFHSLDTRGSFSLDARDLYVPSTTCSPLVYGATAVVMGNVCVGVSGDSLTIIYTVNPGWTIDVVHALITTSIPTAAQDIPGQFPYSSDKGSPPVCVISADKTTSTCTIPVQSAWRCVCKLEIDYFPVTSTSTSVTTITTSSTSTYLTSTTVTYETSSTSTYTTSTTVTYLTSTTSEYSAIGSSTSTTTSTSLIPTTISYAPTTTTISCTNPAVSVIYTTTVVYV